MKAAQTVPDLKVSTSKVFLITGLSNLFELYDYTLYLTLMPILAKQFFPFLDTAQSLLFGFLTFAFSFLFAPLGSIFWAWYGDKFGRKKMLHKAIFTMSVPSVIIAFLPNYQHIGVAAPILLVLCRIAQSFSAGGEVKGAKIFAMEHLGKEKLGITSGALTGFGALGVMLAMFMAYVTNYFIEIESLWRIPFLLGGILIIVGFYVRKSLTESPLFLHIKTDTVNLTFPEIVRNYRNELYIVCILSAMLGALSYFLHAFMANYLVALGHPATIALKVSIIGLVSTTIAGVIGGIYIDKYDAKIVMQKNLLWCVTMILPCFALILLKTIGFTILAILILGSLLGMNAACCTVIMYKLFPTEIRCRGIMICYALGVAIFGGITPYVLMLSAQVNEIYPAIVSVCFFGIIHLSYKYFFARIKFK